MTTRPAGRALAGVRCVVTRAPEQAAELADALRALGADVIEAPAIRLAPPRSWRAVDAALRRLAAGEYVWVVLTSANGVRFAVERLRATGSGVRALRAASVAAVGPGTAAALAEHGVEPALVPPSFTTAAIGRAFPRGAGRVLLLRAQNVEPGLPETLARKGWDPDPVVLYHLLPAARLPAATRRAIIGGDVDALTFASGGTVRAFTGLLGAPVPASVRVVCIGPVTARVAREEGLRVAAVAREHTIPGLVDAVVRAAGSRATGPRPPARAVSSRPAPRR